MSAHAPIAPSSLGLTVACNASVQLQAAAPELPETDEEAEGTAAHIVAMAHASGNPWPVGAHFESGGRKWEVDFDMFNGAKLYAATMRAGEGGDLRLEDAVRCSAIHPEYCYGTPDAWRYFSKGNGPQGLPVLRVGDYKFGHRYVEVFENWQLIAYAVGVMERLQLSDENLVLELILVQPRAYHRDGPVRTWRVRAADIRGLVNIAERAAHEALKSNPMATTGRHCLDCKARHICGTLRVTTCEIVDYSSHADLQPLDSIAVGQELRILDAAAQRLDARRTALAAQAEAMLRAGQPVPFYEMAPGRSALKWNDDATPEYLLDAFAMIAPGVKIQKPLAVCTPRQAIDAGIDEAVVTLYATRPPAAMKLQPISTTAARKIFGATRK